MTEKSSYISIIVFFLFIAAIIGMVWGTFYLIENNPIGADFTIQWLSIHSLVTGGTNPYNESNAEKIQNSGIETYYYNQWGPPKYTSPLISGVVIFPFALLGSETFAHGLWSSLQLFVIFIIAYLSLQITGWKTSWYILFLFMLFTLFSFHVVVPWVEGGLSIFSALFLVLAVFMVQNGRSEASGVFLALALIQPVMVILPVLFIMIWAASTKRKVVILWFFITIVLLTIIALLLVPDWIIQYLRLMFNFADNFPPGNLITLFSSMWPGLGMQLGWAIIGISLVILIIEWWLALRKDFRWFLWTVCFTIVISHWIGIPTIPENLFGMIFALILVSAMFSERWSRGGQWVAIVLSVLLFVWEWILFYGNTFSGNPGMQNNLIIPLPLVLLVTLYWVRWWALKPRGLLINELKFGQIK